MGEDSKIDVLTERVENWMKTTTEYRISLCSKLDKMNERLNNLPCKQAEEVTRAIRNDVTWLQRGAVAVISCLFLMGVGWGTLANTVNTNTRKWAVLEPEHDALTKDVAVLKEKSIGYNNRKPWVVHDGKL